MTITEAIADMDLKFEKQAVATLRAEYQRRATDTADGDDLVIAEQQRDEYPDTLSRLGELTREAAEHAASVAGWISWRLAASRLRLHEPVVPVAGSRQPGRSDARSLHTPRAASEGLSGGLRSRPRHDPPAAPLVIEDDDGVPLIGVGDAAAAWMADR